MLDTLEVSQLPNGIRVVTLAKPEAQSVRVAIHVRVGSRNEPEAVNGASHFIEHMLFKGTPKRSSKMVSQAIESQGGMLNAYTDRDNTCYYAVVPYNKAKLALDVLGDIFYNASFDPKELDRERRVIAEEIRMYDDQPDSVALDRQIAQLWSGHPLGRSVLGTLDGILSMPRKDLLAYRASQYAPSRTVFAFSGRVKHETCVKAVSALAGHLRDPETLGEAEPFSRVIPLEPFSLTRRSIQQTQLVFGWRAPGFYDRERAPAMNFLTCLLGETMMSRLFQSIRERRGLCYSVSSDMIRQTDCGALLVTAGCESEKAFSGAKAILAEMRKLIERPVGQAELRRTRDYLCGRFRLSMDGTPIGWAAMRILFGLDPDPQAVLDAYQAVTAETIQTLAQTYLTPENLAMTVVAPEHSRHTADAWASLMQY